MTDASFGSNVTTPDAPPAAQPAAAPEQSPLQQFGSGISRMLGGPAYNAPDPQATALDQTADTLQQRIKRANEIATNPVAQFLNPDDAAAARNFIPQATEQLQKIRQQKAQMQANRTEADTLGLAPGEVPDEASQADRVAVAQSKALKGDMKTFQGLQAVAPEKAAAIQDQVHEAVAGHLTKAQSAFDNLAGMKNAGQYEAKLKQLRMEGTLTDLEALGMKVPKDFETFNATKGREGQALREARIAMDTLKARLDERANGTPMEEKEQKTYKGRLTTESGQELNNGVWARINGKRVYQVNGMADITHLGEKYNLASPEQRAEIDKAREAAIPKAELEKMRQFSRTYQLATTDGKGNPMPADQVNTNPNVQQGMAEGLASMLRGGVGGANVGLLKIETNKRGFLQGLVDKVTTEKAAVIDELKGKDIAPYLSKLTQSQIRDVMDAIKQYNDVSISNRTVQTARRAGELGLDASALGLGKGEVKGVDEAIEAGRQSTINRFAPRQRATGGGDGGIFLDNPPPVLVTKPDPPGMVHPPVPAPVQSAPLSTPGVGAGGSPPPGSPQPTGPGGGQPITIAGQPVSFSPPLGASPNFLPALQRIESGNEKNPWTSGTGGSSASGAFQFINSTWAANKPAGAPDRAKDATPEQQAAALSTLTAKNAATLTNLKLPVNDTTLYMAHNVGAGGASALLSASPTSDARSIVGEKEAANNPTFFKGRPTVATVLKRYQDAMEAPNDDTGPKPRPGAGGATAEAPAEGGFWNRLSRTLSQGVPADQRDQAVADVGNAAVEHAPVIGGAIGGITGGIIGGAAGAGSGQAFKDYMQGRPVDPTEIAKQTVLGGVLSVGSAARPLVAAVARTAGAGAVEGGAEAAKGGDAGDIASASAKGVLESAGGEVFGRTLGMALHKVWSWLTPEAKTIVQSAAKDLHEANEVLRKEQPTLPGAAGAAATKNPAYEAAQAAKEKAETEIKDILPTAKPEEIAYAHKVTSEGVPKQEAQAARPGATEQERLGAGYRELENEVGAAGKGAVKPTPKLADGPRAAVESGAVPKAFGDIAEKTEAAITAPAKNWQEKWTQLKDARSALLDKEREAYASTGARKVETAEAYRALADTVRTQQAKTAKYVFGEKDGEAFMARLKVLDGRYRTLMEATNGGDLASMARLKGDAGRKADKAFRAFAMGDKEAIAAWDGMRRTGSNVEKDVLQVISAEKIPVLGKLISGAKLMAGFKDFIRERAAGNPATFADMVPELKAAQQRQARAVRDVGGQIGSHAAVQGDAFGSSFQ